MHKALINAGLIFTDLKKNKSQLELAILKTEGQLNHLYAILILLTEAE